MWPQSFYFRVSIGADSTLFKECVAHPHQIRIRIKTSRTTTSFGPTPPFNIRLQQARDTVRRKACLCDHNDMGLPDLANETILSIVANLSKVSDINGLVQVNRRLYKLLNLHLYQWDVQRRYWPTRLHSADGDADDSMVWSSEQHGQESIDLNSFLQEGAKYGDKVRVYLQDDNTLINDAMFFAIRWNHDEIAALLLKHGISIHLRLEHNLTSLQTAVKHGRLTVVRLLLEKGADFREHCREMDDDMYGCGTPLHVACYLGHVEVAQLLLEYGADVNAFATYNELPLHWAVMPAQWSWGRRANLVEMVQTCKLLLDYGADYKAKDNAQKSFADYAAEYADVDLMCLLEFDGFENEPKGKELQWMLQAEQIYCKSIPKIRLRPSSLTPKTQIHQHRPFGQEGLAAMTIAETVVYTIQETRNGFNGGGLYRWVAGVG